MTFRLAFLGVVLAAMPVAIQVPAGRDSLPASAGETRIDAVGNLAEYSLVGQGCDPNSYPSEARTKVSGGALQVEHQFPSDVVIGVRGGANREQIRTPPYLPPPGLLAKRERTNTYVNPYVAYETRRLGAGVGWLHAEDRFVVDYYESAAPSWTAHLRVGEADRYVTFWYMESLPLQSGGYLGADLGYRLWPDLDVAFTGSMGGPFTGTPIGLKARVQFTPAAALLLRGGFEAQGQYYAGAGLSWRIPDRAARR